MSEKISIELGSDFLEKFFAMAGSSVPEEVKQENLEEGLAKIKKKLDTAAALAAKNSGTSPNVSFDSDDLQEIPHSAVGKTVLVVDDLGIVTVQLEALFKKLGFEVTVSRELFDAIEKYKTQDFDYAIVDLFIPTEREGFILIDEIKKLSLLCKLDTRIVVMSASNKPEHQQKSINKGADIFVEKLQGWQDKIVDFCLKN